MERFLPNGGTVADVEEQPDAERVQKIVRECASAVE
jgi:hypothetical protein